MTQSESSFPTTTTDSESVTGLLPELRASLPDGMPPVPLDGEACRGYPVVLTDRHREFIASALDNATEAILSAQELAKRLIQADRSVPISEAPWVATSLLAHERVSRLKTYDNETYCYIAPSDPEEAANSVFARVDRLVERVEARMNGSEGTVSIGALSLKTCWGIARSEGLLTGDTDMERFQYLFKMHPRTASNENGKGVYIVDAPALPATVEEALDGLVAATAGQSPHPTTLDVLRRQAFGGLEVSDETATAFHRAVLSDARFTRRKAGTKLHFAIKAPPSASPAPIQVPSQHSRRSPHKKMRPDVGPAQHFISEAQRESLRTLGTAVLDRLLDGMVITLHAGHIIATAEAMNGAPLEQKERHFLLGSLLTARHLTDLYPGSNSRQTIFAPVNQPDPLSHSRGRTVNWGNMSHSNSNTLREVDALLDSRHAGEEDSLGAEY